MEKTGKMAIIPRGENRKNGDHTTWEKTGKWRSYHMEKQESGDHTTWRNRKVAIIPHGEKQENGNYTTWRKQ